MSKIETYGLNSQDLMNVQWKIAKQKKYLETQTFITDSKKEKTLLDVSYSANLSERYYPRILNKVDTFVSTSLGEGLVPVFLTITADGFFRRMLKGDYSEWTDELRKKYEKHIPNNERNGFYLDYMNRNNALTPKDIYKILGHQLHRFYKCETLRDIKKDGYTYTSIRVTEPHKDGVPHFHILMYVPKEYIPRLYKEFKNFFPAPRNHKRMTYKNTKGKHRRNGSYICDINDVSMYETFGFQIEVKSAVGYILKYILKSFKNLIEGKEIDFLQAWYVHNKIPRIITTHTLVSQDVYHKTAMMESDWHYLTDIKINAKYKSDRLNNYFQFNDNQGRIITGDNGLYILENNGKLISTYGKKDNFIPKYRLRSFSFIKEKPKGFKILNQYEIYTSHKEYSYYIKKQFKEDNSCCWIAGDDIHFIFDMDIENIESDKEKSKSIIKMTDLVLFNEYYNFDFDVVASVRYAMLHNELVSRGLIHCEALDPNLYNTRFYDEYGIN